MRLRLALFAGELAIMAAGGCLTAWIAGDSHAGLLFAIGFGLVKAIRP